MMMRWHLLAAAAACLQSAANALTLMTRGRVSALPPAELHRFLATPANWPRIVASSVGVEGDGVAEPLRRGRFVDELFGLPPLLPLRVAWTCEALDEAAGLLDVRSAPGLEGVATDCRMRFDVRSDGAGGSVVDLVMSYEPASPLAVAAVPVLAIDNYVALNVLLPRAVDATPPLDAFRSLMGGLYGVAGLAHAADCVVGPSALLALAGAPLFAELAPRDPRPTRSRASAAASRTPG